MVTSLVRTVPLKHRGVHVEALRHLRRDRRARRHRRRRRGLERRLGVVGDLLDLHAREFFGLPISCQIKLDGVAMNERSNCNRFSTILQRFCFVQN